MNGGYWDFRDRALANDIFGDHVSAYYGLDSDKHDRYTEIVIRENRLGDPEICALAYDLFCLLYSFDYAESGDTSHEKYHKDVEAFKKRWLKMPRKMQVQSMIDVCTDNLRRELYEAFSVDIPKEGGAPE